uniref:ATP synthase F0 subunit 8 n=1 Tax=Orthoprosopa grisea TaxID=2929906 RepID=UPI0026E40BD7|nr:ATP synthase F0 subunit 8 [Orthoprosopa grisea]WJW73765.1 ATP synthase F0 subunit 8 [Orthoprosopa grisea]
MPQMAPISWLTLFLLFSVIFMLFNMMNYFIYKPPILKSNIKNKMSINSMNWKW